MWEASTTWGRRELELLLSSLRPEDIAEIETSTRKDVRVAVNDTILNTFGNNGVINAVYRTEDREFMGFMGLIPKADHTNLWVLTRNITDDCPRDVIKYGRALADEFYAITGPLYSIINKNNKRTRALCRAMGFTPGIDMPNYKGSEMTFQYMHRS